ncbi:MAG: hypothetical protein PHI54_03595 [Bacteroidales bacterium]|nr:hypothetical protein [Bacteroidales bacterium]
MKPIKSLSFIANWSLRIAILLFMAANYGLLFQSIDFSHIDLSTLIAFVYCLCVLLLFIGGLQKNASLSVISALLIFLLSVYFLVVNYKGHIFEVSFVIYFFPTTIALHFLANGNK